MASGFWRNRMMRSTPEPGASSQNAGRRSIHHKRPERIAGCHDQILAPVEELCLRRISDAANLRVPQRLAGERIVRDDVAGAVAGKDDLTGGRQDASATARPTFVLIAPRRFAGLVVER